DHGGVELVLVPHRRRATLEARIIFCSRIAVVIPLAAAFLIAGCNSESPIETVEADSVTPAPAADSDSNPPTTSVAPSDQTVETSPAAASTLPPPDADPGQVCEKFLKLLKANDRMTAEQLLTHSALSVTREAELQLEPPGGPGAEFEIGAIRYATTRQKIAQVDCVVKETIDGEDLETTITWMVRSMDEGWRISGIVLTSEDESLQDLLSFENAQDVARINSMLVGDEASAVEHQADAVQETTTSLK
ncbi:MAG: hypothetical protein AAF456_24775, partial [Planctomycetota bacterium]